MSESTTPGSTWKSRISLFIATACGLGYLPKAPGTFGALGGAAIYWGLYRLFGRLSMGSGPIGLYSHNHYFTIAYFRLGFLLNLILAPVIALVGVWAAGRVEKSIGAKDPQFVVIDEVSGQQFTFILALTPLNWKYLLLGFILFRLFDIWKPFPARQAESLPGGWGIMADDWIAGVYAALGLWLARAVGM